jgi:CHAD domain-containing protein
MNQEMKEREASKIANVEKFARETALKLVHVMFENASGTKEGADIEHLHDMRVASRRLREALQLFQTFYSQKRRKKVLSQVRQVTRILGIPREMDVNVDLLGSYKPKGSALLFTAHEYLLEIFEFEQAKQRRRMLKAFDKLDLKELEAELVQFIQVNSHSSPVPTLLAEADEASEANSFLRQAAETLQERAAPIVQFRARLLPLRYGNDEELHRLRISVKKCRYCLELLNPLYEGQLEKAIQLAKELQEVLGKIHDYCVVIDRLCTQKLSLVKKSRFRLSKGCQRVIDDFGDTKRSLYPQVEPGHLAFMDELALQLPERTEITTYSSEPATEAESIPSEQPAQSDGNSFNPKTADLFALTPREE